MLASIAENPWTAVVLAPNGRVAELVPFAATPSAAAFIEFTRTRVPGTRSPGPAIPGVESKVHPFATARAIAEAITKWITR